MSVAVSVENLSKRFVLGQTFERTLSSRVGDLLSGRVLKAKGKPAQEFWALQDVSFELNEGEALGIVGANGAGKSTLLKILSRITPPTGGRALVRGRLSSLLEVGTGFHPELTGRENVYLNGTVLGMRNHEVRRKFDEIVEFAGVEKFIDTPVKRYSSGMYVRLAFAVAAHLEPDVLVIDEVLAVGDADFQRRCLGKMDDVTKGGRTVIFVSHNMAAVQKLCSRAIWLRDGSVEGAGDPGEVIGHYLQSTSRGMGRHGRGVGVLYQADEQDREEDARVVSVRLLDSAGQAIEEPATWGAVTFRIEFEVRRTYRSFSAVLQIATPDGTVLMLTSTTPDRQVVFGVEPGRYVVDCAVPRLPLAQGGYVLGAGLAIPGIEYVWRDEALAEMHVRESDVFHSGLSPRSSRYWIATEHQWTPPREVSEQRAVGHVG